MVFRVTYTWETIMTFTLTLALVPLSMHNCTPGTYCGYIIVASR